MGVYSVSNNKIRISVNTFGAELVSMKSNSTELMWQADKNVWPRYAPVLFPIVGKLKNAQTSFDLTQHGFARDKEFILIDQTETALEFELTANDVSLLIYPFHFSLRIRYALEDSAVKIKYIVFNPDSKEMYFSLGAHPGFNCKRIDGESLEDFYLEFENLQELKAEKLLDGLLSGESYPVKLNNNKLHLKADLFKHDALIFKNKQIEKVKLCSSLSKTQITLHCKDWPYFGIWTKKDSDSFVCLEPWFGITDPINADTDFSKKEGIQVLSPYSSFEVGFTIEIDN